MKILNSFCGFYTIYLYYIKNINTVPNYKY